MYRNRHLVLRFACWLGAAGWAITGLGRIAIAAEPEPAVQPGPAGQLGVLETSPSKPLLHEPSTLRIGSSSASAAVAISNDCFLTASSCDNFLRIYARGDVAEPLQAFDLSGMLTYNTQWPHSDTQAAARLGTRAYWIGSHARDSNGELNPGHMRFWATQCTHDGQRWAVYFVGSVYEKLLDDLVAEPRLAAWDLAEAALLPPGSSQGFEIGGLAATPDGQLLIALAAPLREGKALLVPLKNPDELLAGLPARFGKPLALDLDQRGVVGIEYWPSRQQYVVLAGSPEADRPRQAYLCNANLKDPPQLIGELDLAGQTARSLVIYTDRDDAFQLISDTAATSGDVLMAGDALAAGGSETIGRVETIGHATVDQREPPQASHFPSAGPLAPQQRSFHTQWIRLD